MRRRRVNFIQWKKICSTAYISFEVHFLFISSLDDAPSSFLFVWKKKKTSKEPSEEGRINFVTRLTVRGPLSRSRRKRKREISLYLRFYPAFSFPPGLKITCVKQVEVTLMPSPRTNELRVYFLFLFFCSPQRNSVVLVLRSLSSESAHSLWVGVSLFSRCGHQ